MVPAFKEGNYGKGIVNAASVIEKTLGSPDGIAEINTLIPREKNFIEKNSNHLLIALATILAYFGVFKLFKRFGKNNKASSKKKNDGLEKNILVGCGIMFFGIFFGVFAASLFNINIIEPEYLPWTIAAVASLFLTMQYICSKKLFRKNCSVCAFCSINCDWYVKTILRKQAPQQTVGRTSRI